MRKIIVYFCVLFMLGTTPVVAQKPLFTSPIGMEIYTYRDSYGKGVAAVLDTIKSLGITELEGPNPAVCTPEQFKKMLDERGMTMPSIGLDYNQVVDDPQAAAELAKLFGSTYIMVAWIPHGQTFTLADVQKAVKDFNTAGKILRTYGITLCYHDHGYEFVPYGKGTLFDYLVTHTDPRYLSFEMDFMWTFHGGADPAKLLRRYKGRWKLAHLKDIRKNVPNDHTGGTPTINDVAVGTGQINYPEVLKAAREVGIRHYFIEDESPNHARQIPVTIAYLKGLKE